MSGEEDNCREEEKLRRRRIEEELNRADEEAKWFELWERSEIRKRKKVNLYLERFSKIMRECEIDAF